MFTHLRSKPDSGLGPLRALLQSLIDWSHFDPYYFEKLGKLNKKDALYSIQHLRQIQEIRDNKIKEDRKKREAKERDNQKPRYNINELKESFISLMQSKKVVQKRGYELERIL